MFTTSSLKLSSGHVPKVWSPVILTMTHPTIGWTTSFGELTKKTGKIKSMLVVTHDGIAMREQDSPSKMLTTSDVDLPTVNAVLT